MSFLAGIQIAVGIFLVLFGFRLWKITSGVSGFLLGFFLAYYIIIYIWSTTPNIAYIAMGSGLGAGLLIGLFLFFFPSVALFIVAVAVGVVLGILIYDVALIHTGWQYAYFVAVGVGAIVLPLIAICIKKPFIIVITSFYGAMCMAFGVAAFLPPSYFPVYIDPTLPPPSPVPWTVYIFFGAIIAVTVLGIILQACLFAREISWDNVRKHVCPSARHDRYNDDELGTPLFQR